MSSLRESSTVLVVNDSVSLELSKLEIAGKTCLSLDCEGINLGRQGKISLVQIATVDRCFLFDVLNKQPSSKIIEFLKDVLEDQSITKIIHDCRADSDALHHLFGIDLNEVHDTQAWQITMYSTRNKLNLNDTLKLFGCPINAVRNCRVYKTTPNFWAGRPLTKEMIEWASEDVITLFALQRAQIAKATRADAANCRAASNKYLDELRGAVIQNIKIHPTQVGRFIGKKGGNIHALEISTGAMYHTQTDGLCTVYGQTDAIVARAVAAARPFAAPYAHPHRSQYGGWFRDDSDDDY
jgi:exonuclease 3'-5' domain-containing protein 1